MARGKLLRTRVRAEKALVKAKLQATKEWEERTSNFQYLMKKELVNLIRKIDPLEMVAVGSLTIVIQPMIAAAAPVTDAIATIIARATELAKIYLDVWRWFGLVTGQEVPPTIETSVQFTWLLSFVIAFIIVRHPEVMTEMFTGATKLTGFALGLLS